MQVDLNEGLRHGAFPACETPSGFVYSATANPGWRGCAADPGLCCVTPSGCVSLLQDFLHYQIIRKRPCVQGQFAAGDLVHLNQRGEFFPGDVFRPVDDEFRRRRQRRQPADPAVLQRTGEKVRIGRFRDLAEAEAVEVNDNLVDLLAELGGGEKRPDTGFASADEAQIRLVIIREHSKP